MLFTAAEFGFTPVGLDLRADNVSALQRCGIEAHCKDISDLELDVKCSVVSMADVLEHIPFPKNAVKAAYNLLEQDGVLIVSMPNTDCIVWKTLDMTGMNPYWGTIEHYHNFSRAILFALLREVGFTDIQYGVSYRYRSCMEVIARKTS